MSVFVGIVIGAVGVLLILAFIIVNEIRKTDGSKLKGAKLNRR